MYYVAHRLFAAHDRALGALVARRIAEETGPDGVFLPFCDTGEEDLLAEVKGRRLFQLDRQRLGRLSGMLAVLHGPSLDDGVCMEIGYAAALGIPVVVLTTDFIRYGPTEHGPWLEFPDPLLQTVASAVVRLEKLGPVSAADNRFDAFGQRNNDQVTEAVEAAVTRLLGLSTTAQGSAVPSPRTVSKPPAPAGAVSKPPAPAGAVFCEPSPYWPDDSWSREWVDLGYRVRTAERFAAPDPLAAAAADWAGVLGAPLLGADVSGPETPPGAAAMIGACAALGRRVIVRQHRMSWTNAAGREPNWRNLMIQYAVHARLDR